MEFENISASYDVGIAKKYGINCAILLNKLLYLQKYSARDDGFCWRTEKQLEDELGLSRKQQELAIKKLENENILETKNTYIQGTQTKCKHYKILRITDLYERNITDLYERDKSQMYERDKSIYNNHNIIIKNNNKKENIKEKSDYFDNQELNNAFIEWLEYKKEKHQSYKEKGLNALINKINKDLKEYSIDDIIDGIHNSIANNYQGLFYKKSNYTNKNSSPVPKWLDMDLSSDKNNGEEFDLDEYLRTKGIE